MDRTNRTASAPVKDLLVWHWNCNGYPSKKAILRQHLKQIDRIPDVIMIQETHSEDAPKLPGYRTHASPPSARISKVGAGRGVCTFVRKGITLVEHVLVGNSAVEYCADEIITGKKKKESTFVVNVYSNPAHRQQKFRTLIHKAVAAAQGNTLLICGDFNAPHREWGYPNTTVKGRDLVEDATEAGLELMTDPAHPTRIGTSVTRDTTTDLTFIKTTRSSTNARWNNTGKDLGSDHYIIEVRIPLKGRNNAAITRQHRITDWEAYRKALPEDTTEISDIEQWSRNVVQLVEDTTQEVETDETIDQVDSRLAHLLEAKQSIQNRWKKQRTNRRLRKKVAELNRKIEAHCRVLCTQQWHATCSEADGQMHKSRTWNLLRHLLDETKTKGYHHNNLAKILHRAVKSMGEEEVRKRIDAKYLPATGAEKHPDYGGKDNDELDKDIEVWEVKAALQTINTRSAAGPDKVTNKALKNLNETAIEALTHYFNKCWSEGKLPRQWKTAKTILIPKPGKPPSIENLRPISLTSCVGKVLENVLMNRWQRYLEDSGLYPNSVIGFRGKLGTQDAMLLLKHEIVDNELGTQDNRAVLGLDIQSAFDKVRHSAILAQVSRLNMGRRTYEYIRDFLTDRTTKICAGDIELPEKQLGSVGTPQGSVISPLLFNLVMIGVANRLEKIEDVRHTIYADDVTLWVTGGCDGHIETVLQEAIDTIEDQLQGTGLVCSPSKSELLIIPPKGRGRRRPDPPSIKLYTQGRQAIPEVDKIRVLGLILERSRLNGTTVTKLATKAAEATRLIKRISTRRAGMKEENLNRLAQSFAISHIAYVAAFHNWRAHERAKIDAIIRKAYKTALGLLQSTSTEKFLELGVHNTLEEIAEAQQTAQKERLSETRTGRHILQRLSLVPSGQCQEGAVSLPKNVSNRINVCPIPRNMNPDYNQERRAARAKALVDLHASDDGAVYVDAAEYQDIPGAYTAVAVKAKTGETKTATSIYTKKTHQAEEVAIALAIADPSTTTVLSDSRTAVRNYAKNRLCKAAASILCRAASNERAVTIKWFPAHMGPDVSTKGNDNHNETANAVARAFTFRATADLAGLRWKPFDISKDTMTSFNDIVKWYRNARRTRPPPHPGLTREEAVIYRQLQTGSLLTPVIAKYVCPQVYESDVCRLCKEERATMAHILWNCQENPREATENTTLPPQLEAAVNTYDHGLQLQAVQQVTAALERQKPDDAEGKGGRKPLRT